MRKGYSTYQQQKEATKRYYENNADAKEKKVLKTLIQYYNEYIVNSSFPYTLQLENDLKNIETYVDERRKKLKEDGQ